VHVAAQVITSLVLCVSRFSLRKNLTNGSVADLETNFANNAVFSLAVTRSINKKNSLHDCSVSFAHKSVCAVLVITYQIKQVLKWQLRISNHELLLALEQDNLHVEKLSSALLEMSFDVIRPTNLVSVNCIHRNLKVIQRVVLVGGYVAANVITLKNFIFIEWEGVFKCNVLNVGGLERIFFRRSFKVIGVSNEFVQNRDLLQRLHVDIKNVLNLGVRLLFITLSLPIFVRFALTTLFRIIVI